MWLKSKKWKTSSTSARPDAKYHILTAMDEGWIIPAYAELLAAELGCSIGKAVRPDALVHFVLPYYNIGWVDPSIKASSKVVSFFTHREEAAGEENKIKAWDRAAEISDLRIMMNKASAAKISGHGPTVCIPLPILPANVGDLKPKKYRVGVSYRPYGSGRKGEALLQGLRDHRISQFIEIVETGGRLSRQQMSNWYAELDLYLCVSLVEGGPLGVVEAEVCGIRSIGPKGVGWCDEYCTYLYDRGDLESLVSVLEPLVRPRIAREDFSGSLWTSRVASAAGQLLETSTSGDQQFRAQQY